MCGGWLIAKKKLEATLNQRQWLLRLFFSKSLCALSLCTNKKKKNRKNRALPEKQALFLFTWFPGCSFNIFPESIQGYTLYNKTMYCGYALLLKQETTSQTLMTFWYITQQYILQLIIHSLYTSCFYFFFLDIIVFDI